MTVAGGPIALMEAGDTDTTTFTASYVMTPADISGGAGGQSGDGERHGVEGANVVQDLSDESDFADN